MSVPTRRSEKVERPWQCTHEGAVGDARRVPIVIGTNDRDFGPSNSSTAPIQRLCSANDPHGKHADLLVNVVRGTDIWVESCVRAESVKTSAHRSDTKVMPDVRITRITVFL